MIVHQPPPARDSATAPSLDAEVVIEDDRWRSYPDIENVVLKAANALLLCEADLIEKTVVVTVVLADDARLMALNGTFRGKPNATNVLSFPADPRATEPGEPLYLGDIILARETVESEAREQGMPVVHHVQHLTIHGLLHLFGYDHQTGTDAELMEGIETSVLKSMGIDDPYAEFSSEATQN